MNPADEALLAKRGNPCGDLRRLLKQGKTLPVPGAFNAICAKILEDVGYPVLYVSGAGVANGVGGYPDIGMMTQTEVAQYAGYIARAVNIPVIADADTGYGEVMNVFRTVQVYEQAGLAGLHIEDQVFPKRCGHLGGKAVISTDAMTQKIAAAVSARNNPDFLMIARVDSKAVNGIEDAIERACAYLSAGADMIFPEALETQEEFTTFTTRVREKHPGALFLANMTEFGKSPYLTIREFEAAGYNMVIYPMTAFRLMMKNIRETMRRLLEEGTQQNLLPQMATRQELYDLIHYDAYQGLDSTLNAQYNQEQHSKA